MAVIIDEKNKMFHLRTKNTSYIFAFVKDDVPVHLYWGKAFQKSPEF